MALLKFLKGNYTSLSTKAIAEGQILICGDTGEMFVDVASDKRVKIGDFSVVANIAALEALDASAVPTSRLYYVEDGNILARSNGTSWIQINKQKTLAELGGVSLDVYNTKMTALDKADTDNATAISGVDTRLQAAEEKLKSVATTEGLSELTKAVEGNTAKIDTIMGDADTTGSMLQIANAAADGKDAAIKEAKDAADAAQGEVDALAQTHATDKKNLEDAIALKADAEDVYTKGEIDSEIDAINDAIADKANAADVYTKDDIDGMVSDLEDADAAINELIGDVEPGKTVVDMIADAQSAATYDDTEVRGLIDTNKDAIEQEVSDRGNAISGLKTELEGKIADVETSVATEKSRAEGIEEGLRTDVDAIKADYLKAADKEDLQTQINTIMNNPDTEGVINSINEFTKYIEDHGEIADGFRADIDANAKAIEDHEALAAQTYETKEDAAAKFDEVKAEIAAKAVQADWNQNDSTAADFIKNRPFYEEANGEYLFKDVSDAEFTYREGGGMQYVFAEPINIVPGKTYTFDWDGQTYECTPSGPDGDGDYGVIWYVGGMSGSMYIAADNNRILVMDGHYDTINKLSLYASGTIKQLDEKFIPDTIARLSEVNIVKDALNIAKLNIDNLQYAINNLGDLATKDVVSESDLDADLAAKVNAYADVQSALDTHINRTDIHVTTEDKAKWDAAEKNAKDHSDANLETAKAYADQAELDAIAAAAADAESKVAAEAAIARAAEQANAQAISDEATAREQAVSGVQTALDTYKTSNDTAVAGKADKATTLAGYGIADAMTADQINALLTWGSF